jgi:hypothetical protein
VTVSKMLEWKRFHILKRKKTTAVEEDIKTLCHVPRDSEHWISGSVWAKIGEKMNYQHARIA